MASETRVRTSLVYLIRHDRVGISGWTWGGDRANEPDQDNERVLGSLPSTRTDLNLICLQDTPSPSPRAYDNRVKHNIRQTKAVIVASAIQSDLRQFAYSTLTSPQILFMLDHTLGMPFVRIFLRVLLIQVPWRKLGYQLRVVTCLSFSQANPRPFSWDTHKPYSGAIGLPKDSD